jgi:hypothetical protein
MSIESFIKKVCKQTAVYWGNPQDDGYGGQIFDYPQEIKVRWEDKSRIIFSSDGKELESKASIMSPIDLDIEGYLFLGTLLDLYNMEDHPDDSESYPESDYYESSYMESDDSDSSYYYDDSSYESSYLESDDSSYLESDCYESSFVNDSDDDSSIGPDEWITHPKHIPTAFEIIGVDKTPLFASSTKFVREYHIGFKNA